MQILTAPLDGVILSDDPESAAADEGEGERSVVALAVVFQELMQGSEEKQ